MLDLAMDSKADSKVEAEIKEKLGNATYLKHELKYRSKTSKIGDDWFYRFTENRPVKFNFFKKIKMFKKIRVHFKIFGENRIQKFKVMRSTKFSEIKNGV
jgi:hypothetical protein